MVVNNVLYEIIKHNLIQPQKSFIKKFKWNKEGFLFYNWYFNEYFIMHLNLKESKLCIQICSSILERPKDENHRGAW